MNGRQKRPAPEALQDSVVRERWHEAVTDLAGDVIDVPMVRWFKRRVHLTLYRKVDRYVCACSRPVNI